MRPGAGCPRPRPAGAPRVLVVVLLRGDPRGVPGRPRRPDLRGRGAPDRLPRRLRRRHGRGGPDHARGQGPGREAGPGLRRRVRRQRRLRAGHGGGRDLAPRLGPRGQRGHDAHGLRRDQAERADGPPCRGHHLRDPEGRRAPGRAPHQRHPGATARARGHPGRVVRRPGGRGSPHDPGRRVRTAGRGLPRPEGHRRRARRRSGELRRNPRRSRAPRGRRQGVPLRPSLHDHGRLCPSTQRERHEIAPRQARASRDGLRGGGPRRPQRPDRRAAAPARGHRGQHPPRRPRRRPGLEGRQRRCRRPQGPARRRPEGPRGRREGGPLRQAPEPRLLQGPGREARREHEPRRPAGVRVGRHPTAPRPGAARARGLRLRRQQRRLHVQRSPHPGGAARLRSPRALRGGVPQGKGSRLERAGELT